jgi:E3 ubiquitin-protein ligase TRIP12
MDTVEQRAFLRFVTGSPRLPPGGLAALQPRLTVVRKHPRWAHVPRKPCGGCPFGGCPFMRAMTRRNADGASTGPTPVGSFQEAGMLGTTCAVDADLPSVRRGGS